MENDDLRFLLEKYLEHGRLLRGYRDATIRSYGFSFAILFKMQPISRLSEITPDLMEKHLFDGRTKRQWSSVTVRHYHKHYNSFFKWCVKKGLRNDNPLDGIELPPLETRIPRKLNLEQSQLVLDAAFHLPYVYEYECYRNRAIIGTMLFAGLRKREIINLKNAHVDLHDRTILVEQGKGGKDRLLPINERLDYI